MYYAVLKKFKRILKVGQGEALVTAANLSLPFCCDITMSITMILPYLHVLCSMGSMFDSYLEKK
jgi:hypothetical protein